MPNYSLNEDDRHRLVDQIDAMRAQIERMRAGYGDRVAWDSEQPEDLRYLYDPDHLLMRTDDPTQVDLVVTSLNETGHYAGEVTQADFPPDRSGREPLPLTRVLLPGRVDGDRRRVPLALDFLDAQGVNSERRVASPDHWLHVSAWWKLCPATEPQESGHLQPWPRVVSDHTRGDGVVVSVVDTGWHAPAGQHPVTSGWLTGVQGDAEPYGPPDPVFDDLPGPLLDQYAGHGTFIAGVVRCLAPAAEVFVERFPTGPAILESEMVGQLRETLEEHSPQIINLSAGATTREDRPLLSFEAFWEQDLSHEENCLLVAAAGNDGVALPFWPAAFDWAVGVGALDLGGQVSDFSNHAVSADVYALGRNLVNAYPDGTLRCNEPPDKGDLRVFGTGLARWSGTSFAAPVVVGLIAAALNDVGNVDAAWAAVRDGAARIKDPMNKNVLALLPPYT